MTTSFVRRIARCMAMLCLIIGLGFVGSADAQTAPAAAPSTVASPAASMQALPTVTVGKIGNAPVSMPLQVLVLMTAITFLPAALLGITAFTRIIIVLGLLRQALGTGQTPGTKCCSRSPCSSPRW